MKREVLTLVKAALVLSMFFLMASEALSKGYGRGQGYGNGGGKACLQNEVISNALEAGDYTAWQAEMTKIRPNARVLVVVTEENFGKYATMHKLMQDGKFDEADKIRAELGLGQGRKGDGKGMHRGRQGKGSGQGRGNGSSNR